MTNYYFGNMDETAKALFLKQHDLGSTRTLVA